MRAVFFALYYAICVALLMLTFRVDTYLRFNFSKSSTIGSYLLLALLLSIVAIYLAPWATQHLFPRLKHGGWTDAIATVAIVFLVFCVISLSFGPLGLDLRGTRIRGIFFSEWKFTNFIFYDAILLSLIAGVLRRF